MKYMNKEMPSGKCYLCQGIFPKNQMTKHLETCMQKQPAEADVPHQRTFRILAEGHGQQEYWLYFEIPAEAKFSSIDRFLRKTWVECCGHMSAFKSHPTLPSQISKSRPLGDILNPGMKFYYEYDFGSTTELALKVISEQDGKFEGKSIRLLARNEPPPIKCERCDKPATRICAQCINENMGWLCDDCAPEHECGEEMLLPMVNSPRVGVCGYTGS
jgi:hypothetical protein